MLRLHNTDHLFTADSESGAVGDGSGCCHAQPSRCRERLFSHKLACGEKRDGSFFSGWGDHRHSCTPLLKIKDRVRWISLRKEGFLWRQFDDPSLQSGARKESGDIESWLLKLNHGEASFRCGPPRTPILWEDRLPVYATELPPGDESWIAISVERTPVHFALDAESDYTPAGKHFDQFCTTCSQAIQISWFLGLQDGA